MAPKEHAKQTYMDSKTASTKLAQLVSKLMAHLQVHVRGLLLHMSCLQRPPAGLDGPLSALAMPSTDAGWPFRGLERRHLLGGALLTVPAYPAGLPCLQE